MSAKAPLFPYDPDDPPLVSVVVPICNNSSTVASCMRSLREQSYPKLEFLIVDDSSDDDTLQRAKAAVEGDQRFQFFQTPRRSGPAPARNVALREVKGMVVAFIDGDMEAPPPWVEQLVFPILRGETDCTGGPDVVPSGNPLVSRCLGYSMDSWLLTGGLRHGDTKLVRYLPGTGNLALRSDILERTGLFNEFFFDHGEDKEFLYRVQFDGWRISYIPEALAWHHRAPSLSSHLRKQFNSGIRRVDIWDELPGTFEFPHLAPALLLGIYLLLLLVSFLWVPLRPWLGLASVVALLLLLADGMVAARRLGDPLAVLVAPISSFFIPFGYGAGTLVRLFQTRVLKQRRE